MTEFRGACFIASALAAGLAPLPAVAAGRAIAFAVAGNDAVANLLAKPNHAVRVRGLSDEARNRNLASLKYIAAETTRRALEF